MLHPFTHLLKSVRADHRARAFDNWLTVVFDFDVNLDGVGLVDLSRAGALTQCLGMGEEGLLPDSRRPEERVGEATKEGLPEEGSEVPPGQAQGCEERGRDQEVRGNSEGGKWCMRSFKPNLGFFRETTQKRNLPLFFFLDSSDEHTKMY